ncbi:uncharacterized protein B0H18DRAFT_7795 [Fomitopsis serialis]|uniref:uncharacterized protein n=1 Tax=Fomitopsis serialis TaxID=139415 RepID=UPI002007B50A|nr:uncharacterized protein B0H18DRAFT_7795 [Neoantrodia serialis]KAH9938236.1 hypothetical protein B0H18DRAFT_7795 [Neoantrodia serialis]
MDLPSSREIDLENLLRERDAQVAELTDEVTHLRQYLSTQPPPSVTDPASLPPAWVSILLPHIRDHATSASTSSTVTAALTQRYKTLQEENDELYELLKAGETGKLKEDVRALRRVVQKLEGALKDSHQVISSLSAELDKSHEALAANSRQAYMPKVQAHSQSPAPLRNHYPQQQSYPPPGPNGSGKLPPTGPRAQKKPRLSESHASPAPPNLSGRPGSAASYAQSAASSPRDTRERRPESVDRKPPPGMDTEEDERSRPRSPDRPRERDRPPHTDVGSDRGRDRPPHTDIARGRDRPPHTDSDRGRDRPPHADRDRVRDRERDKDREKNRERERDRDRTSRRNGGGRSGGGGGGGRRSGRGQNNLPAFDSTDRTLAERMGL